MISTLSSVGRTTCIALLLCTAPAFSAAGQNSTTEPLAQPTIMVIPFAKQGQSLRSRYEQDELARIAITKVKEGFDTRGVNTIDLRAKLAQISNLEVLQEGQQSDLRDEVVQLSGADVFVEVDANPNKSSTGNSVTVILTAYDAFSGESFSNKVATSQKFYTENYELLIEKAVETEIDNFLNTINEKFGDIARNGRTIVLNLGIQEGADYDLDSEIGDSGQLLSEVLEEWVHDNAYQNAYHIQGTTANKILFDQVKVPLRDDRGQNYRISKFAATLRNYLKSLGYESSRVINGNILTVTME